MSSFLGTFITIRTADQAHTVAPAASATAEITASAAGGPPTSKARG